MKMLSVSRGLSQRQYKIKLTPEEFARLDILAKEAGMTKDEFLEMLLESAWKRRVTRSTTVDDFIDTLERFLDEKGEAYR